MCGGGERGCREEGGGGNLGGNPFEGDNLKDIKACEATSVFRRCLILYVDPKSPSPLVVNHVSLDNRWSAELALIL